MNIGYSVLKIKKIILTPLLTSEWNLIVPINKFPKEITGVYALEDYTAKSVTEKKHVTCDRQLYKK